MLKQHPSLHAVFSFTKCWEVVEIIGYAQSMLTRKKLSPKNVLGFFGTILGIWVSGSCYVIVTLIKNKTETNMIPWIAGFGALFLLIMFFSVLGVLLVDPSKLVLGAVSGTEYQAIQEARILGDSRTGEREVETRIIDGVYVEFEESRLILDTDVPPLEGEQSG